MNRHHKLFLRKYKNWIWVILGIIAMVILWVSQAPRLARYEAYRCAVYGYEADCKTKLPEERRLK